MSPEAWSAGAWARFAAGLAGLALVQVSLVNFLPTPWAVPDLVAVGVLAIAVARGPLAGGLLGAWAGLVLDLIPPAAGPLGGWMLVLALAGLAMGRVSETYRPGPIAAMAMLAAGVGSVVLARAAVLAFAGSAPGVPVLGAALGSAAWALVLAPVGLLAMTRSARSPQASVRQPVRPGDARSGWAQQTRPPGGPGKP